MLFLALLRFKTSLKRKIYQGLDEIKRKYKNQMQKITEERKVNSVSIL